MKNAEKHFWVTIPPWLIIGALLILIPIFVFWTIQSLHKQKEDTIRLLVEKGAALIRSFEAGTRTGMMGMMGMRGAGFRLQNLLTETAQEPDIVYLMVVDAEGTILAHSDQGKVGGTYGKELDLKRISSLEKVEWRQVPNPSGADTFEVYRRFSPAQPRGGGPPERGVRGPWQRDLPEGPHGRGMREPWQRDFPEAQKLLPEMGAIIFVGLDMATIEAARQDDRQRTVIMALVLFLIGCAGIVSLFLAQAYRSTRTSLSRIKAFSDQVVEKMPVGLLTVDNRGTITSFNQAAEAILHLNREDARGRLSRILPRQLWELTSRLSGPRTSIQQEIDCSLPDGKVIPMDISISSFEDDSGATWGQIVLFRDLTEVRGLQREIETNRRLASIGMLAAGVAHEIRNPLSSIKGFATYFKERYRNHPDDQKTAEIVIQEVDRLNRVITQLLEFARPLAIQKKRIPLQILINHSLQMVETQAQEKNIAIEKTLASEPLEAVVDPDRMNQVLLNLYLNAMQSMEGKGGVLTVTLSREKGPQPSVKISVKDTGTGIAKEDLDHVFDPYFTTKQSGTGLGLAIVHKIIESHQGEIRVESEPGHGTTVSFYLPLFEGRGESGLGQQPKEPVAG
ncbi:MAG: signal transduction histidine kinase [Deltaproteobacteria bacterium]|nr:signal transduction histidine kinase [Deltaproteobacteria bacterium]